MNLFHHSNLLIKRFLATIYPKHQIIPIPALSPTMTKGNIGVWKKKPGDSIQPGDVLVEIETDKANMEFECQEEGYLAKILVNEGTKEAKVGSPLAIIVNKKEDVSKFTDYKIEPKANESKIDEASTTSPSPLPSLNQNKITKEESKESKIEMKIESKNHDEFPNQRLFISPAARILATHNNINTNQINGSGPHGRIVKSDILDAIRSSGETLVKSNSSSSSSSSSSSFTFNNHSPSQTFPPSNYVDIPLSSVRKIIAERLSWSMQNIPHYYLSMECNMNRILELRLKYQESKKQTDENIGKDGSSNSNGNSTSSNSTDNNQNNSNDQRKKSLFKPSINDFIIKAASAAMKNVPMVNSSWMKDSIRQYNQVDISIAVATPYGLITPIIRNVSQKGLFDIARESKHLVQLAKENRLKPEQFQGGTFTISNLGMYGIKNFTAIINPPQSCILAVGGLNQEKRKDMTKRSSKWTMESGGNNSNENEETDTMMTVTMSCDHRVVDGAMGAEWLQAFKKYIEEPALMIY